MVLVSHLVSSEQASCSICGDYGVKEIERKDVQCVPNTPDGDKHL